MIQDFKKIQFPNDLLEYQTPLNKIFEALEILEGSVGKFFQILSFFSPTSHIIVRDPIKIVNYSSITLLFDYASCCKNLTIEITNLFKNCLIYLLIKALSDSDNWVGLEVTWKTRFLNTIKETIPEDYKEIYEKVLFY